MLDELTVTAAVGTSRKPLAFAPAGAALDEALAGLDGASPEAKLLGAVAILTQYEACGRLPQAIGAAIEPAGEEERPACSRRAGELVIQLLGMPNNDAKAQLVGEWLAQAADAQQRVPHRVLPALLDYGTAVANLRPAVAAVIGQRGQWLMRLNPRWRFDAPEGDDAATVWSTGTAAQRLAVLSRLRGTDAAAARQLIGSTWKEDAADDRAAFVAAMLRGLCGDDEAFLETCLDDRSKQVRAAAADLLARLPKSAYVARMIERAAGLLRFTPGKKGGLLKKAVAPALEVALPPDAFAADWAGDGIVEKPEGKIGRRQWWLQQIIAAVPPSHWATLWQITPRECVAAVGSEFEDVVLAAWNQAAARNPDAAWINALLMSAAVDGRGPLTLTLLNLLPADAQSALTTALLESPKMNTETVTQVLRITKFAFDRQCGSALTQVIDRLMDQQSPGYTYSMTWILQAVALRVPADSYDALLQRWTGAKYEPCRKGFEEFFQVLQLRRDIQREFNREQKKR